MYVAGLDIGSRSTCAVIWDGVGIRGWALLPSGVNPRQRAEEVLSRALKEAEVSREKLSKIVATGYGRYQVEADLRISEISCQAKGVSFFFPQAQTVIDIGGQDSKVILLVPRTGKVLDFAMNDKCAAGTGRFLELMAQVLEIDLEEYGKLVEKESEEIILSSTCAVFAESELVGLIAQGKQKADLAAAVCRAVAQRVLRMAERIGIAMPVVFTGGVAQNRGVIRFLEKEINGKAFVPSQPLLTAALGACLLA
ncbi:MAG: acyl-CoA dehydratase activase [Candidatus Caldatribacteriaceae bacterium]